MLRDRLLISGTRVAHNYLHSVLDLCFTFLHHSLTRILIKSFELCWISSVYNYLIVFDEILVPVVLLKYYLKRNYICLLSCQVRVVFNLFPG